MHEVRLQINWVGQVSSSVDLSIGASEVFVADWKAESRSECVDEYVGFHAHSLVGASHPSHPVARRGVGTSAGHGTAADVGL